MSAAQHFFSHEEMGAHSANGLASNSPINSNNQPGFKPVPKVILCRRGSLPLRVAPAQLRSRGALQASTCPVLAGCRGRCGAFLAQSVCSGNAQGFCHSLCISRLTMRTPGLSAAGNNQQSCMIHGGIGNSGCLQSVRCCMLNSVYSPIGTRSMRSVVFPEPCRPVHVSTSTDH